MTTSRRYGSDTEFGAWLRRQPDMDSREVGLAANDIDWDILKYRVGSDTIGSRSLKCHMQVEIKSHGATPNPSQLEALYGKHQLISRFREDGSLLPVEVWRPGNTKQDKWWCFGVYVLSMSHTTPDNSDAIWWGCFNSDGELSWTELDIDALKDILRLRKRPDTFAPLSLRRHHKTQWVTVKEETPLFTYEGMSLRIS